MSDALQVEDLNNENFDCISECSFIQPFRFKQRVNSVLDKAALMQNSCVSINKPVANVSGLGSNLFFNKATGGSFVQIMPFSY